MLDEPNNVTIHLICRFGTDIGAFSLPRYIFSQFELIFSNRELDDNIKTTSTEESLTDT